MGKGNVRLEELTRQNDLLREQNDLLREQNELLRGNKSLSGECEVFIENIDRDEMRNGFLVTSHRKKLWNAQIGLIQEFARICKKHNLRWFAFSGTLIGAARHKGFIPWDDDVDIFMFRPDYEKFKQVVTKELKPPYFLDAWFNYRLESEEKPGVPFDKNLQLVTREQEKTYGGWWPFWPVMKIRDSRTAMIQWSKRPHVNQGIWIDIFAFDSAPPFTERQRKINWALARELFMAIAFTRKVRDAVESGKKFLLPRNNMINFLDATHRQRALYFEKFMSKIFFNSESLVDFRDYVIAQRGVTYKTEDFSEVVYLPFEKIEIPVPVGYENILTARYGDWRKMIYTPSHVKDYSVDISYKDYFASIAKRTPIVEDDKVVGFTIEDSQA